MPLSPRELEQAKAELQAGLRSGQITIDVPQPRVTTLPESMANASAATRMRARRRANGECPYCGSSLPDGEVKCATCRDYSRKYLTKRRTRFKGEDRCTNCGRPRDRVNQRTGKTARQCSACRSSNAKAKRSGMSIAPTP